jgi:sulfur transfer complex TusBCD TusB component (DsrH family)
MPKIPTFKVQGTITAEPTGVTTSIQAPLSMAKTLEPIQKAVTDYAVKEKIIQDKTEALKLENESILELNTAVQNASKMMNKEQANLFLKNESTRIRNKFRNQASSSGVQRIFDNNYLIEEQKKIYAVDNAVYKNIVQESQNQKSIKKNQILSDYLFSNNALARQTAANALIKLEDDDLIQDEDTRNLNKNNVAVILDFYDAKKDLNDDPINTFLKLKDNKNYPNLTVDARTELFGQAKRISQAIASKNLKEYLLSAKEGKESIYSKESLIAPFEGDIQYAEVLEKVEIADIVRVNSNQIKNSNYGEESNVIENIAVEGTQLKYKKDAQAVLQAVANEKAKRIQTDVAGYYGDFDSNIIDINQKISFAIESNNTQQEVSLIQERNSLLDNIYDEKEIPNSLRKYISQAESKSLVAQFKAIENPNDQIGFLEILNEKYGDKIVDVYSQLEGDGLPSGALVMVSTNSVDLKNDIAKGFDVKTLETNIINSTALKKTDLNDIKFAISTEMEEGYNQVINNQPIGSISQAAHINKVTDALYQATLYKMFNENIDKESAAKKVVQEFNKDYIFKETFWIPNDINGEPINQKDIQAKTDFILDTIKETNYLDKIDLSHYGSTDPTMTIQDNIEVMKKDIKDNAVWYLNPKGDGLWLYVTREGGTPLVVSDKSGEILELNFLDTSTKLPITNEEYEYTDLDFIPDVRQGRG